MCHFITLIVPHADSDALWKIMKRHARAARPIDNPSIRAVLRDGERQYLTTRVHCDCGTVLAARHGLEEAFEEKIAREVVRWRRKGWTETKIARAIEDQRSAEARPIEGGIDSLELWNALLSDLGSTLRLPYAGLFVRFYGGAIADEAFYATRRDAPTDAPRLEALAAMREDEVTIFPLR
jgi:hypothetical protein